MPTTKAKYLYDDFSSPITRADTPWYRTATATGAQISGGIKLNPTLGYDYIGTTDTYSLVGSYISWRLVENCAKNANNSCTINLRARVGASDWVEFVLTGGRLASNNAVVSMTETVSGTPSVTTFTYDPSVHVWFRIREAAGTVYWETSVDGSTWTVRRSKSTTLDLSSIEVQLEAGRWAAEAGTYATIDDFNLFAGVPTRPPGSELTDEFSTIDPLVWYYEGGVAVSGGKLELTPDGSYSAFILTYDTFDLSASYFSWKFTNATGATTQCDGAAMVDSNNWFGFMVEYDWQGVPMMVMREKVAGTNSDTSMTYDPDKHVWARVRGASGVLYWETSFNGVSWTIHRSKASSLNLTAVKLRFTAGYWGTESSPGKFRVEAVNAPDPGVVASMGWFTGPLAFGASDGGTLVKRAYFPASNAYWEPIPDDPVLDPMSSTWAGLLVDDPLKTTASHPFDHWDFGKTLVTPDWYDDSTPRYPVKIYADGHSHTIPEWITESPSDWPLHNFMVPWKSEWRVAGSEVTPEPDGSFFGWDGWVGIYNPKEKWMVNLWRTKFVSGEVRCEWGTLFRFDKPGEQMQYLNGVTDYHGSSSASSFQSFFGVIRVAEIDAGEIPHAMFFASDICKPAEFRFPALSTDGSNLAGVEFPMPQGARVQLDPSIDLSAISGITRAELTIGRALQKYGAYLGDNGGARLGLLFEHDQSATGQGWDAFTSVGQVWVENGLTFGYQEMSHIPWGSLRVLKNWDGSA
jgi:hypothetical protein